MNTFKQRAEELKLEREMKRHLIALEQMEKELEFEERAEKLTEEDLK